MCVVRGCGGVALDRGPCLEGATSRPAAKSLPKGAKSYSKIMLQTAKGWERRGERKRGVCGCAPFRTRASPPPSFKRTLCVCFPPRALLWMGYFPMCVSSPSAHNYAQGRGGRLNSLQHQWETLFLSWGRSGDTHP